MVDRTPLATISLLTSLWFLYLYFVVFQENALNFTTVLCTITSTADMRDVSRREHAQMEERRGRNE